MKGAILPIDADIEPYLQPFLDSFTDQAVFTVDTNGFITSWSDGCVVVEGFSAAEAIGQHFGMVYTVEDQERGHPESNLRTALENGQCHEERTRIRKNGEAFMAEVSIYPMEQDGQVVGYSKIVSDVSERRRVGDERDDLDERLKRSHLELEGFCHSIAHDLRGPIRSIVARSRLVHDEFSKEVPTGVRTHMDAMSRSAVRLADLVDDLLGFARLGQGEINRQEIDFSAMVLRLASEICPHHHGGKARVKVQANLSAHADKSMLELVLRNLLENSCKYSRPGVNIRVGMDDSSGETVFYIQDDGIGFDMQYVAKIFEPFQRLHGISAYEGTGIGLANVTRIIQRHGGRIWAEAELDKGATFYFTLGPRP